MTDLKKKFFLDKRSEQYLCTDLVKYLKSASNQKNTIPRKSIRLFAGEVKLSKTLHCS